LAVLRNSFHFNTDIFLQIRLRLYIRGRNISFPGQVLYRRLFDIVLDGVEYEIESPFDIDKKKKKTATVKKVKKTP